MATVTPGNTGYFLADDAASQRTRYEKIRGSLFEQRATFDAHWQELGSYFSPRRTRFFAGDRNRGDKRNQNIINSKGRFAARTLQSGLHAGLTSPARPWMRLQLPDAKLSENKPVREWLDQTSKRMLAVFAVSNVYNTLPLVYGDMGVFGTGCMFVEEDPKELFRCTAFPIGSYAIGQDQRGMVTTFVRDYEISVRQVVQRFGTDGVRRDIDWSNISTSVKKLWDDSNYEEPIEITWIVKPNDHADERRLESKYLPFTSCHYETGGNERKLLRQSGFRQFPIMAPRWDITGEDNYGTDCPGMTSLGDNKQLQIMERRKGQAIQKQIDPPLVGPPALRAQKTSLVPGDVTYVDEREGMKGLRPIHEVRFDLSHMTQDIQAVEYRIARAFFEDLFLMMASSDPYRGSQPPTAREVSERHEEKLLALGPVLERTNDELLDPLVDRVFDIMLQAGFIEEPPPEIEGANLRVEYVSILSQAQKLVGVGGADRFVQTVAPMMELFPEVRNKINIHQIIDNYVEMLGVDPRIVRTTEEAEALDAAAQEQQQAAAQSEQAVQMAQAMKMGSETKMGTDSALDRVVEGVAQQ